MQYNNKLVTCYEQGDDGIYLMRAPDGAYVLSITNGVTIDRAIYYTAEAALSAFDCQCQALSRIEVDHV